jgi:Asp-tRNA(Asn)/Glu-tRNA(Gln) amidotransferase C subunit
VVPNDSEGNTRTVVKYIQDLTDGIVTDGVITELRKDVDTNTGNITALQNAAKDYATKTELGDYETVVNANKVREDLAQYKIDNDAALAKVRETADAAANAEDVEAALRDKADQDEFAEI